MQFAPTTRGVAMDLVAKALPGLVSAFRFDPGGSVQELSVDQPFDAAEGWLWLHFNLADARACNFLKSAPELPAAARELLVAHDGHQRLHADGDASTASLPICLRTWRQGDGRDRLFAFRDGGKTFRQRPETKPKRARGDAPLAARRQHRRNARWAA